MNAKTTSTEIMSDSVEDFAQSVGDEFEKIKDKMVQNSESRVKNFIDSNVKRLLGSFENSSWITKALVGSGAGAIAYYGVKLFKRAVDGIFGLGHWVMEKIGLTRKNSLKKILKIVLGVSAVALIPLLYQGIKTGQLKITDIVKAWQKNGSLGVFSLLTSQFPEGLSNMSQDVINYFKKYLGEKVLGDGVQKAEKKLKQAQEKIQDGLTQTKQEKSVSKITPEDIEIKAKDLKKAVEDEGVEKTFERLVHDNSALILKNGSLYVINAMGELLDLSRWLTLQWVDSMNEVKAAILKNPEKWFGALSRQYLEESLNFMILSTGVDFVHSFFDRSKAIQPLKSVIAGVTSGMKWGAYPFKLIGAARKAYPVLAQKSPQYIRFVAGGVEFLSKAGTPIAKATAQAGKLVFWEGGKWVALKAAESVGKKQALEGMGKIVAERYKKILGEQIAKLSSKSFLGKITAMLGWRAPAIGGMIADNSTGIGILNDPVAIGLSGWLSYDIYQFIKTVNNANKFNKLMTSQELLEITHVEILDQPSRDAFEIKLQALGIKESDLSPENYREILDTLPLVRFKIERSNGISEIYTLKRGDPVSVKIMGEDDKVLRELESEDIETVLETIPAPVKFKKWDIQYNQPSSTLKSHYRMALRFIKNETAWQQIQMDIIDTRTIRVFRSDTGTESYITRKSDNKWYISEYPKTGFDFFQALSMTNLINRVGDLVKGYWVKGSENPFYTEDGDIYYKHPINDSMILSGKEKSWKKFFNDMSVSDKNIIDLLNYFHNEKNN